MNQTYITLTAFQIPLQELEIGRTYVGRGRNGNVGKWDGEHFLVVGEKFGSPRIKVEPYCTDESGCFQPFKMIDEGKVIEPFGKSGWDAHYGSKMSFD